MAKQTNQPAAGSSSSSTAINLPINSNKTPAEDPSTYSLDIAERAKLRSRARSQKSNKKPPPSLIDNDVIEISSDGDDLNIRPPPKATKAKKDVPSPRKRAKKTHTALDHTADDVNSAVLPIATSNPSSQLPPSDPPPSTPPLSTPVNALPAARAGSSPLSSPLLPPPRPPKRKRKALPELPNDSDDDGSVGHRGALRKDSSGLAMPPPPPPFFPEPTPPGPASDTVVEGSSSTRAAEVPESSKP